MSKLLITRPEHEPGVKYLSCWSREIIDSANSKGMSVVDLHKEKATSKEFCGRLKKVDPSLVVLNGHGNSESVTGHDNEPLITTKNNELLKNRITYAVSCDSAKKLGEACADDNTAYIGYDEKFVINLERQYLSRPLEDKRAAQFLKASNQVPLLLIKKHTAKDSCNGAKMLFREAIKRLLPILHSDPVAREDIADLFWDMNHLVYKGNGDLTI